MEDRQDGVEGGGQLPARRTEEGEDGAKRGWQLSAHRMEDGQDRVEARQQLPARRVEVVEQEVQQQNVEVPEGVAAVAPPLLLAPQVRVVQGVMGGKEDFTAFKDPIMSEAGPVTANVDGWGQINSLSGWDCSLMAMGEVQKIHKEKFV